MKKEGRAGTVVLAIFSTGQKRGETSTSFSGQDQIVRSLVNPGFKRPFPQQTYRGDYQAVMLAGYRFEGRAGKRRSVLTAVLPDRT